MAFNWAHATDPNAKLFYNDYGGEGLGAKSDAIYALVQGMISRGVPINGVGLEMHLQLAGAPSESDISANIARLGALGLEVHISEMDVRLAVNANGVASAADLASQATLYQNVLSACQANSNCTEFLTWGITDLYSWIPSSFPGYGAGLLLDQQYNPKPAYTSVADTLRSNAPSHPAFFAGEDFLSGTAYYLQFPDSSLFGYYEYLSSSILYHFERGYEAFISGAGGSIYFYDFGSGHWWYTSPSLFPTVYDFTLGTWIYYFPDTKNAGHYSTNPRYFSNLTTGKIFTM